VNTTSLDRHVSQTAAPNGLTVLSEQLPAVRSVAVGIWVRTASAHEHRSQMGVSHLLEHMVFKGTERRTARQLVHELESRGGSLDAFTGRDHTCFQAHILDEDLPRAVDVLTDLIRRPLLRETDLSLERNVVLEEISTVEDTPDDLVFELFADRLWPQHPYGYSILGTRESVGALRSQDLRQVHGTGYYRGNCVIAAAGQIEHERLLDVGARLLRVGPVDGDEDHRLDQGHEAEEKERDPALQPLELESGHVSPAHPAGERDAMQAAGPLRMSPPWGMNSNSASVSPSRASKTRACCAARAAT